MISSSPDSYMTIGAFALSSGLSIEALRHYHELGLLVPAHVDPATAYRRYSADQLPRAQAIRRLKSLDMTLDQIAEVLAVDDPALVRDSLERQKRHLVYTAKLLRLRTDQIDRLIERGSVMPSETGPRVIGMTVMGPDVEALRAFYEEVFGLEFVGEDHGGGLHYHATGGSFSPPDGLFLFTLWQYSEGWENTRTGIEMYVSGVDEVYKRALEAGGRSVHPPFDSAAFPRSAIFTDPAGNQIQVYEED
jgi:DNA-binding transcriptional MerR regulator/catechol 2,3-dioxygenase-like lactoylglutathione lyase family enzyme